MRAHTLGTGLLLSLAAAVLTGPAASATDPEPFLAAPNELLNPGDELQIRGYCPDHDAGALTSDVLTDIQVWHDPAAGPPNLKASGVVADGTTPGIYQVSMDCSGQTLTVTLTVVEPDDTTIGPPADFVSLNPAATAPGQKVQVQARCDSSGDAVMRSPVLRTVTLAPDPEGHQPWAIHGTTTVTEDAAPGDHPVSVQCGGGAAQTTITVLARKSHDGGRRTGGQVSRVPRGAPETGEGPPDATVPLLAVGLVLGTAAGASAITWRMVRR
ncbi:MAG: hypothetical protein ACRDSR_20685 [Pseudonocardiaceae bacterium]